MKIVSSLLILASVACSVTACSVLSEDSDSSSSESITINPEGTETMSTLIVQLPTGSCLPGGSCSTPLATQPNITLDGASMSIGGAGLRVKAGVHTLTSGGASTEITLVAGASRTMVLPVAKQVCTNATSSTLAETHFGKQPALRNAACPNATTIDTKPITNPTFEANYVQAFQSANCQSAVHNSLLRSTQCSGVSNSYNVYSFRGYDGVCINIPGRNLRTFCENYVSQGAAGIGLAPNLTANTAVVPGTYGFPLETATGMTTETRALAEGDVKTLSFTLPLLGSVPDRFNTNLKLVDASTLPDAVQATITSSCGRNYAVPANSPAGTLALKAFKFSECSYSLNVGGRAVALTQAADNNVSLYRVDINDVTVTREDGTKYQTQGQYEVYFGGNRVAGPYTTETGLHLLSGAYEIVVTYSTAEGEKTNHYNISL